MDTVYAKGLVERHITDLLSSTRLLTVKDVLHKIGVSQESMRGAVYGYVLGGLWTMDFEMDNFVPALRGRKVVDVTVKGRVSVHGNLYERDWKSQIVEEVTRSIELT